MTRQGLEGDALAVALKDAVSRLPFIANAYLFSEVDNLDAAEAHSDSFAVLFGRSQWPGRAMELPARYGVHIRYEMNTIGPGEDPATHGSPYHYDRAVPLIFLGRGVGRGVSIEPVSTVDVAPTLARLAGIDSPSDLDGVTLFDPVP